MVERPITRPPFVSKMLNVISLIDPKVGWLKKLKYWALRCGINALVF